MSTRLNGVICWYCNSEPDEPCEACDEVNAIIGHPDALDDDMLGLRNERPGIARSWIAGTRRAKRSE